MRQESTPSSDPVRRSRTPGNTVYLNDLPITPSKPAQELTGNLNADVVPWVIEFRIVGTPHILRLPASESIIIGRADPSGSAIPDLDLTGYDGQRHGVSRRHTRLVARDNRVTVEDLGSVNGTYINDQALAPGHGYRIHHGDRLRLGRLDLQVHFIVKPRVDDDTMVGTGNHLEIPVIGRGQNLLILDDNADLCRVIQRITGLAGFTGRMASTVQESIALIDENPPEGIILELVLADGSGLELVQYLRSREDLPYVPIIAITDATAGYQMNKALEAGVDIFLGKPLAVDELIDVLRQLIALMPDKA